MAYSVSVIKFYYSNFNVLNVVVTGLFNLSVSNIQYLSISTLNGSVALDNSSQSLFRIFGWFTNNVNNLETATGYKPRIGNIEWGIWCKISIGSFKNNLDS